MVKYDCDLFGPGILKSTLSQEEINELTDFLHAVKEVILFNLINSHADF